MIEFDVFEGGIHLFIQSIDIYCGPAMHTTPLEQAAQSSTGCGYKLLLLELSLQQSFRMFASAGLQLTVPDQERCFKQHSFGCSRKQLGTVDQAVQAGMREAPG